MDKINTPFGEDGSGHGFLLRGVLFLGVVVLIGGGIYLAGNSELLQGFLKISTPEEVCDDYILDARSLISGDVEFNKGFAEATLTKVANLCERGEVYEDLNALYYEEVGGDLAAAIDPSVSCAVFVYGGDEMSGPDYVSPRQRDAEVFNLDLSLLKEQENVRLESFEFVVEGDGVESLKVFSGDETLGAAKVVEGVASIPLSREIAPGGIYNFVILAGVDGDAEIGGTFSVSLTGVEGTCLESSELVSGIASYPIEGNLFSLAGAMLDVSAGTADFQIVREEPGQNVFAFVVKANDYEDVEVRGFEFQLSRDFDILGDLDLVIDGVSRGSGSVDKNGGLVFDTNFILAAGSEIHTEIVADVSDSGDKYSHQNPAKFTLVLEDGESVEAYGASSGDVVEIVEGDFPISTTNSIL